MSREPHIDHETLDTLCSLQLYALQPRCVLLYFGHVNTVGCWVVVELVGHDYEVAFGGIFVGLELVVGGLVACAACEEEQELRGRVWVVGGFGDVAVYATEL